MAAEIQILFHLEGHERVDVLREEDETVVGTDHLFSRELVCIPSAAETEALENAERSVHRQAVHIHDAGLFYDVVRVVLLVDAHRHSVGIVCHLGHCVDDESVVPGSVIGGDHIESVSDAEERGEILLVGGLAAPGKIVHAELLRQILHLLPALLIQGGYQFYAVFRIYEVFALLQHGLHGLGRERRPGTVLYRGDLPLLEVPLGQVVDELLHEGIDVRVVCGGRQHYPSKAERVGYGL